MNRSFSSSSRSSGASSTVPMFRTDDFFPSKGSRHYSDRDPEEDDAGNDDDDAPVEDELDVDNLLQANNEDFYDDLYGDDSANDRFRRRSEDENYDDGDNRDDYEEDERSDANDTDEDAGRVQYLNVAKYENEISSSSSSSSGQSASITANKTTPVPNAQATTPSAQAIAEEIPSFEDVDWDTFPWKNFEKKSDEMQLTLLARIVGKKRMMEMFSEDMGLPPMPVETSAKDLLKCMVTTYGEEHNVQNLGSTLQLIVQKALNFDGFPRCESADMVIEQMQESNNQKNQQLEEACLDYNTLTRNLSTNNGTGSADETARARWTKQKINLLDEIPLWMRKIVVSQKVQPSKPSSSPASAKPTNASKATVASAQATAPSAQAPATVETSTATNTAAVSNKSVPLLLSEVSKQSNECLSKMQAAFALSQDNLRALSEMDQARIGAAAAYLQRELDRLFQSKSSDAFSSIAGQCPSIIRTVLLSKLPSK